MLVDGETRAVRTDGRTIRRSRAPGLIKDVAGRLMNERGCPRQNSYVCDTGGNDRFWRVDSCELCRLHGQG